ncbi:3'-5' exonuclease [Prevotella aurantiaca]
MKEMETYHLLDESQQKVVEAQHGHHLVLASPGCGKTHILAQRIRHARQQGLDYADMLCLTFTNRAAREMQNRIRFVMKEDDTSSLQVGNVHHFCSKFLFEEGKVPADTSIIDDEEAISIIAEYRQEGEDAVMNNYKKQQEYKQIILFSHLMFQMKHGHEWKYYLHPECFTDNDREAIKHICHSQGKPFNEQTVLEIYENAMLYADEANSPYVNRQLAEALRALVTKMYYAQLFATYKEEHAMLDFEDLLLHTYNIYKADATCPKYKWIQVDEVQDLNAMQLAIIDLLVADDDPMVMYLGDEQQAIFSFMGAKIEILSLLKTRCKGNIHHLLQNHRSPKYLLDVFNDYAEHQLHIDKELLPLTDNNDKAGQGDLVVLVSNTVEDETDAVAATSERLFQQDAEATTAVIVNANADADKVSRALDRYNVNHLKVSGRDLFDTPAMKTIISHISLQHNEQNILAWSLLMKGLKVFESKGLARRFLHKLRQLSLSPTDFLLYSDSNYTTDFLQKYSNGDLVVFDTETTGLNIFADDIIEIAAIRLHKGEIVGEPLDLYIRTDKPIQPKLGEKENPMYAIYHQKMHSRQLLSPAEALQQFWQYVGDAALLGHNVAYDSNILDYNMRRYTPADRMKNHTNPCFDSLKLIRLLAPGLPSYKLEKLLEHFQLAGINSHQAIDDVTATISLVRLCAEKAAQQQPQQVAFMTHKQVVPYVKRLRDAYAPLYNATLSQRYELKTGSEKALVEEVKNAYNELKAQGLMGEIERLPYFLRYLEFDLLADEHLPNALVEQINRYMLEISTMKESDFCNSKSLKERVYVTTVHKAKGLEFDNVIVFDAASERYPNKRNTTEKQNQEDARKFYVAMSRAKRRLIVAYSLTARDWHNVSYTRELTPFMDSIVHHFEG